MLKADSGLGDAVHSVFDVVLRASSRPTAPELIQLLAEGVEHLGADVGCYASLVREEESIVSHRLLLACDPLLGLALDTRDDAQLRDGLRRTLASQEPFVVPEGASSAPAGALAERAAAAGFRSAFVVPVGLGGGVPKRRICRVGLLVLGSRLPGFFQREDSPRLRILARALATELHNAYGMLLSRERMLTSGLSPSDLDLLRKDRAGLATKAIARELNATPHAIDNRFHRVGLKLGVRDRHSATRIAVEFDLI